MTRASPRLVARAQSLRLRLRLSERHEARRRREMPRRRNPEAHPDVQRAYLGR